MKKVTLALVMVAWIFGAAGNALACSRSTPPLREYAVLYPPGIRGPIDAAATIAIVRPIQLRLVELPAEGRPWQPELEFDLAVERVLKGSAPGKIAFGMKQVPETLRTDLWGGVRVVREGRYGAPPVPLSRLFNWQHLRIGFFGAFATGADCLSYVSLDIGRPYLAFINAEGSFIAGARLRTDDDWILRSVELLIADPNRQRGAPVSATDLIRLLDEKDVYEMRNCARQQLSHKESLVGDDEVWRPRTEQWSEIASDFEGRSAPFPSNCRRGQQYLVLQAQVLPINAGVVDLSGLRTAGELAGPLTITVEELRSREWR